MVLPWRTVNLRGKPHLRCALLLWDIPGGYDGEVETGTRTGADRAAVVLSRGRDRQPRQGSHPPEAHATRADEAAAVAGARRRGRVARTLAAGREADPGRAESVRAGAARDRARRFTR